MIKFPKEISIGAFKVKLKLVDGSVAKNVGEMQGVFLQSPPVQIMFDKDIIDAGGSDAVNLVIHELGHLMFYDYSLRDKDEETVVNSIGNFYTQLFFREECKPLKDWILNNV